jgi:hypothetical protein
MHMRPNHARLVATVAAVILSLWSTVVCLTGGGSRAGLHACCKNKMHSAKLSVSHQCCVEDSPNYYASAPHAATPAVVVPVVVALTAFHRPTPIDAVVPFDAVVVKPPGPPTYVVVSSFRL